MRGGTVRAGDIVAGRRNGKRIGGSNGARIHVGLIGVGAGFGAHFRSDGVGSVGTGLIVADGGNRGRLGIRCAACVAIGCLVVVSGDHGVGVGIDDG